jgi:hypothetical protein
MEISRQRLEISCMRLISRLFWIVLLVFVALIPATGHPQKPLQTKPPGSEPLPEPAIPAILAAFDKYEVVAMPEGEGWQDQGDFILTLLRAPAFPDKVNDIEVECGNSPYQPVLDRYIAGDDVPFTDVRKVWRNTTQPACGTSGFFEELFPWCAPSIRSFRRQSDCGYSRAILPLSGTKSNLFRTF